MDLTTVERQFLEVWLKHSSAMKLISTVDGKILWANDEFLQWIGYTLGELRKLTWIQISVPDENLDADLLALKNLDAWNPRYSVKKQYIPKNEKPSWGTLTVMRFPSDGEIKICGCTWEPLKNGTAAAFTLAMEKCDLLKKELQLVNVNVSSLTSQSEEDRWIVSTISMARKHPRLAGFFLVVAATIFGANNVIELLQRIGYIPVPQVVAPIKPTGEVAAIHNSSANSAFYELDSDESQN